MAGKKKKSTASVHGNISGHIEGAGIVKHENIIETLKNNYLPYAMSVIISRALPEIDGFKPSHRKILYTMYGLKLLGNTRTKSANVVGQVMKLNPHGDQAIYETMVRLSAGNETLLHAYVDSKGNFGKSYSRDMDYAAARYTEVKLADISAELFKDIDKNTVDFMDNYDSTTTEPVLLPVTFPTVLVNSNMGIAVGMASSICSFNLKEVCDTTVAFIKNPDHDIIKTLKAPDFFGGGFILYNKNEMQKIYNTGRGSFKVRGKHSYDKVNNCIDITQIPPTTTIEAIIDRIISLSKSGKIKGASDVRDETDLSGLKITIDLKRGTDHEQFMKKIYRFTPLEDSFSCNFNILVGGKPQVLGVRHILAHWIDFRMDAVKRRFSYELVGMEKKLHLLEGLSKILLDIDKAVKIVRETSADKDVIPNLIIGFGIDEIQANFVAEIKLRNLNKDFIIKRIEETEDLKKAIAGHKEIIASDDKRKNIIIEELLETAKKYGKPRQSLLIGQDEIEEYVEEDNMPDYPVTAFFSKDGYFKKITPQSLRVSGEQKLKEDDEIIMEIETSNKAELLFFTNKAQVYKKFAGEFEDGKTSNLGDFIPAVCEMDEGELPIFMHATEDFSGFLTFFYENGKAAKVAVGAYETKLKRKKLINAYSEKSPLIAIFFSPIDREYLMISTAERMLIFNSGQIVEKQSRSTQGVFVIKMAKKHSLVQVREYAAGTLTDEKRFKSAKIPSSGGKLKDDEKVEQISLFD